MKSELAETLALQALEWLAKNEELLPVFLGSTGVLGADVGARAADPEFLGAVLEFVMMDDAWVVEFCNSHGLDYNAPMEARQALPGGDLPHWT